MSNMRGLDTQVRAIRRRVFKEVAKLDLKQIQRPCWKIWKPFRMRLSMMIR